MDVATIDVYRVETGGRVAAFVEDDGNVTFAMGPNFEGKVHHVTLQGDLNGAVVSTIDRIGGPPGAVTNS